MSKPDIQALLASARRPERTVALCLRGDLQAQVEELERQLDAAEASPGDKLGDTGVPHRIAEQIEAVRAEMAGSTIVFTLRAVTRRAWTDLVAAHPAVKDSEEDQAAGFHVASFFPALIVASIVEPDVDPAELTVLLDEKLTAKQFDQLAGAALALNVRPIDVPFSHAASRMLRLSEQK